MGYDLHITRAANWAENEGREITRGEWLTLVAGDPELTPDPANGDDYARWSGRCQYPDPWFSWCEGDLSNVGSPGRTTPFRTTRAAE